MNRMLGGRWLGPGAPAFVLGLVVWAHPASAPPTSGAAATPAATRVRKVRRETWAPLSSARVSVVSNRSMRYPSWKCSGPATPAKPTPFHAITLETRVDAESGDDRSAHVAQTSGGIERLLEAGLDDLQIDGGVEPACDRDVVVHLDRILALEAEVELLAEERHEVVAELHAGPADAEGVERPPRHHALAGDADVERVLDRIRDAVGHAEPEEDADAAARIVAGAPEVLVEVVVDRPGILDTVDGLRGDQQPREEVREDPPEHRP